MRFFRKRTKKSKIFGNLGKKCTKFEDFLKKCRWLRAIIAHNKVLEQALTLHVFPVATCQNWSRILSKFCFYYEANLSKLINFYSLQNYQKNLWFSDNFRRDRNSLICLNSLNIRYSFWRRSLKNCACDAWFQLPCSWEPSLYIEINQNCKICLVRYCLDYGF